MSFSNDYKKKTNFQSYVENKSLLLNGDRLKKSANDWTFTYQVRDKDILSVGGHLFQFRLKVSSLFIIFSISARN